MRSYEHTINVSRKNHECISLIHNGDEHIGNVAVDEGLQRRVVERAKEDDKCYWFTTGDCCEFIMRGDPRFESGRMPDWFTFGMMADPARYQILHYNDIYKPVADKCLATIEGNHEYSISKHFERDVYREQNDVMGIPLERRLGTGGFLRLRFVSHGKTVWRPTLFLHHGTAGGKTKASILLQLETLPRSYEADIYCVGHAHKKVVAEDEHISMDRITNRVLRRKIYYSATGSYMAGITEELRGQYPERKLMYPQGLGPVEFQFYPNIKQVRVVL